ncbi:DUF4868 domain-containing protein [Asticcacaulis sp. YBE204]|uniref:DUF4868 domain-containing protein n=1 Tax=Asticcacaulis sp. YBE204 TaxID=1282363 RepID=UPI0003C3F081|nr:DUF4868 domain-containing protein [Asticcacaulis sp. YBE204]ESQ79293.1 hypothetical protein AEYBE204_09800 [Asticcacaulis sp. YBE204]
MTLLAYCKTNNGNAVKRIPMTNPVQNGLEALFLNQENAFRAGRPNEVAFDGDWNPDEDELLTLVVSQEVANIIAVATGNALALPVIDTAHFEAENIRALFTVAGNDGAQRLLVQRFTGMQLLNRKRALLLHENNFRELTEPAFTLGASLCCVVENGLIKFDSYHNLRAIFELTEFYQEATDADIDAIAAHASINIAHLAAFKEEATQTLRKLIHKVMYSGVLDQHTSQEIQTRAAATGLALVLDNGILQVPEDKALARQFFRFLDDSLYEAPLSGQRYVTNSKRAI